MTLRVFVCVLIMVATAQAQSYRYVDSPIGGRAATGGLTTGPPGWKGAFQHGPVNEMLQVVAMPAYGRLGLYLDPIAQKVGVIENGRLYWIAGTGTWGHRDGPAEYAEFRMGGAGYATAGGGVDSRNNLYVAEGHNAAIRKIYRDASGRWQVTTAAGRGTLRLRPGEKAPATKVALGGPLSLVVDGQDNVWFIDGAVYRLSPDGMLTAFVLADPSGPQALTVTSMAVGAHGQMFFLDRRDPAARVWKLHPDGRYEWVAGITAKQWQDYRTAGQPVPIDGPVDKCSFFDAGTVIPAHDGSAIYVGAGDEFNIRRIKDGRCSTWMPDGTFAEVSVRNGGAGVGWPAGMDAEGRIYTTKAPWIPPDGDQWGIFRIVLPPGVAVPAAAPPGEPTRSP